jgi:hypothetical protein
VLLWLIAAVLGAIGSLSVARYASSPVWIDALIATGGCCGLAAAMFVGLVARRAWSVWKPVASLLLGIGAALARASLIGRIQSTPLERQVIDFPALALAISTVVWGAVALLWGALAVADALEPRAAGTPRRGLRGTAHLASGALGVSLGLYGLAPLWSLLGLRINHWTVLGLFGLAAAAYGIGAAYRWLARRATSHNH